MEFGWNSAQISAVDFDHSLDRDQQRKLEEGI
jgi:hypothetical protein